MVAVVKVRRGLESGRTGQTPAEGEFLYTTDEKKLYIGDGTTAGGNLVTGGTGSAVSGGVATVKATVDLTTASAQDVGNLPADADVLRTYLDIDTPSDTSTTVTVGDATNGLASYMASTENDPELSAMFIADNIVYNGGTLRAIKATVANPGSVGSGTCIVEYRST